VCARKMAIVLSLASATPERHILSLHDALPIYVAHRQVDGHQIAGTVNGLNLGRNAGGGNKPDNLSKPRHIHQYNRLRLLLCRGLDRKSTRLNSSHVKIAYAVFCSKKKTVSRSH